MHAKPLKLRDVAIVARERNHPSGELMVQLRIGISDWRYPGWRAKSYPKDLPQRRELEFASRAFNSIEINRSFYSLRLPSSFERWYEETPAGFLFSVKGAWRCNARGQRNR